MKRILSLGALAMDVVLNTVALPVNDSFSVIDSEVLLPGGSGANVSTMLSALGTEVYQGGQVGDDRFGTSLRQSLEKAHINQKFIKTQEKGTTLHTYIVTAPLGNHCILANLGNAIETMEAEEELLDFVSQIDCLYVDLFYGKVALKLAREAKKQGVPIVYNMQCVPSFMEKCGTTRAHIEEMLALCDLLIAGREGYFAMTVEENFRKGMQRIQKQYAMAEGVVCTCGAEGAFWWGDDLMLKQNAFAVSPVDTTGAGDCFTGALIYQYFIKGSDKKNGLEFASGAAALSCLTRGGRYGTDENTIYNFIQSKK